MSSQRVINGQTASVETERDFSILPSLGLPSHNRIFDARLSARHLCEPMPSRLCQVGLPNQSPQGSAKYGEYRLHANDMPSRTSKSPPAEDTVREANHKADPQKAHGSMTTEDHDAVLPSTNATEEQAFPSNTDSIGQKGAKRRTEQVLRGAGFLFTSILKSVQNKLNLNCVIFALLGFICGSQLFHLTTSPIVILVLD
ncbi:hypothetical protein DTO013E5_9984 [Penicillium roqueforti]|uniref:uncharacterized protein n=1 Tax=Penicillium solitum TaxID=60172 RepID=UPI001832756C|nr:hypothetical protein HAV15_005943 [Penicillium sp. str. \